MKEFSRDLLLDPNARTRDIFEPDNIRSFLDSRQNLPYDFYGKKIWMLTNIELWFREVVEARKSKPLTPPSKSALSSHGAQV